MAAIQVNMRVPEVLLARINAAAPKERTEWILEACRMRLDGTGSDLVEIAPLAQGEGTGGSIPLTSAKPDMQALREICAGKVAGVGVLEREEHVPTTTVPAEIPICSKTWWEDGEQCECLMDLGHLETKHGMRGMVRKLDA